MNRTTSVLAPRHRRQPSASVDEDDGTQVERPLNKTSRRPSTAQRKVTPAKDEKFEKSLRQFVLNNIKLGVPKLLEEFVTIRTETQAIGRFTKEAFDANVPKNRYKDVLCVDETRVILKWPEGKGDYIHANWLNIPEQRKFICTQAPTEATIEDFWRMIIIFIFFHFQLKLFQVWQEKCRSVVMLCNLVEQGKRKCEQYWPNEKGETMDVGCLKVKKVSSKDPEDIITQTKLELTDGSTTVTVDHFCWNNWPDRGVPPNFLACFRLLNLVKSLTPIVVHCSAGIGRTGTIVGLDVLMSRLQKGDVCTVEKIVRELRDARHGSVQTDIQYVYMVRVIIALAENKKVVKKDELTEWLSNYDKLCKARGCA